MNAPARITIAFKPFERQKDRTVNKCGIVLHSLHLFIGKGDG